MKKILLLTKSFVILSLLFCSIGVFADIPRTINVQGKVTNDSGGPILNPENVEVKLYVSDDRNTYEFKPIQEDLPVKIDSEGLYNVNMDLGDMKFNVDNEYTFEVEVTADGTSIRSKARPFASNPFAFYASTSTYSSTATYSLMLDPLKGEKLKNENFYTSSHTYTIKVGTAAYAINASSITRKGSKGQVWGMDTTNTQGWINPGDIAISTAAANKLGGIMLGDNTGLYIPANSAILMLKAATASTIGGVIVSTGAGTGLTLKDDGTLSISPATTSSYGVIKVTAANGLTIDSSGAVAMGKASTSALGTVKIGDNINVDSDGVISVSPSSLAIPLATTSSTGTVKITQANGLTIDSSGAVSISTDTKPLEGSEKLLTSGVIYSTMTEIYDKIAEITLEAGDGISIQNHVVSVSTAANGGLKIIDDRLGVSVDGSTMEINGDGIKVKGLPVGSTGSVEGKFWGFSDPVNRVQGWVSLAGLGVIDPKEGLTLDEDTKILKISTATGTGLIFSDNTADAVLKISTGTGLAINDSNEIVVSTGAGLAFDSNNGIVVSTGIGLAFDDNKVIVSTGAGLAFDSDNRIVVSTGIGLGIDDNKIIVSTGAGLTFDTNNRIAISTGVGLGIDTANNTLNVTTAPYAQQIVNSSTVTSNNGTIQVWAKNPVTNEQGWYTATVVSSDVVVGITTHTIHVGGMGGSGDCVDKVTPIKGTLTYLTGADLAEIYQSTEKLVPGDVVSIDTAKDNAIVKTKVAEDTMVAGVISTEPGVLMNQDEKGYKLALVGKVPTKVCNEGGAIKRGDLLVSASIPGYAKKAGDNPKVGTVIGKALENSDSQKGTILVLVNLQ